MRVLVTGKRGQLGQSIQKLVDKKIINKINNYDFIFVGRDELDLGRAEKIISYFDENKFDIIINCAAFTRVDEAQTNHKQANLVNYMAVKEIAKIAKKSNMSLIHISTDFVFDGLKNQPYIETDVASPLNIYGETKFDGEIALLSIMKLNAIILRTGWVYSEYGNNFVDTVLNLAKKNNSLSIVSDQIGTPTYVEDLAQTILTIICSSNFLENDKPSEIYHFSNEGECSWYDFAAEIVNIKEINCIVNPINTDDYPLPAIRPKYSVMNKGKIANEFDLIINHWKDSLKICLRRL